MFSKLCLSWGIPGASAGFGIGQKWGGVSCQNCWGSTLKYFRKTAPEGEEPLEYSGVAADPELSSHSSRFSGVLKIPRVSKAPMTGWKWNETPGRAGEGLSGVGDGAAAPAGSFCLQQGHEAGLGFGMIPKVPSLHPGDPGVWGAALSRQQQGILIPKANWKDWKGCSAPGIP